MQIVIVMTNYAAYACSVNQNSRAMYLTIPAPFLSYIAPKTDLFYILLW